MVRLAWCSLILLTACPPKNPGPTMPPPQPPSAGCPAASEIYVASYLTQEPGKGRSGWVLPMQAMPLAANQQVIDYQAVDQATALATGIAAAPAGNLWLVAGGAPCQARIGGAYLAKVDGPPASVSVGYELEGCPGPTDPQEGSGVLMVSQEPPSGCTFEQPRPMAQRLGAMDAKQQWHEPERETPIPPVLVPALPKHDCAAPGCESLWAIAQIEVNNQPVAWAGALNWLAVGDPATQCAWQAARFSGFFVPGDAGAQPVHVTEGQSAEHPLALSAALVDSRGARVLIADGPGEYATYDLSPGKATLGHHVVWMSAPEDAWSMIDHLGPVCDRSAPVAAPLPRDAKPVSPYP
jgi:hypothetical protein